MSTTVVRHEFTDPRHVQVVSITSNDSPGTYGTVGDNATGLVGQKKCKRSWHCLYSFGPGPVFVCRNLIPGNIEYSSSKLIACINKSFVMLEKFLLSFSGKCSIIPSI